MRKLIAATAALGFSFVAQTAHAQSAREILTGLYVISIAVDVCDLEISGTQQKQLDAAIAFYEGKVGLSDRKADKVYSKMEEAAEADQKAFCKEVKPIAKAALRELKDQ